MARSINEKVNSHLQAALDSLERERVAIDDQIRAIRLVLGQAATSKAPSKTAPDAPDAAPTRRGRKRRLSAEARARIAAAQKKRWVEFRKKKSGSDS